MRTITSRPAGERLNREELHDLYHRVRASTEALCRPLQIEDCVVQTMPEVSPTKWHLGHTSWFFETFVLAKLPGYGSFDDRYSSLFNSYYNAVGEQFPRPSRGVLSRPTLTEVFDYRRHVDREMRRFFDGARAQLFRENAFAIELGLNHEEQHQELVLTDVKHVLASNPLEPVYSDLRTPPEADGGPARWIRYDGGAVEVGHAGDGFAFDNERSRHLVQVQGFELADRLVTCGDYVAFMEDRGYGRPELWLSDGWDARGRNGWQAPLYWRKANGKWLITTLCSTREIDLGEPVCHVSFYEADAFARWAVARLPREEEWELAASGIPVDGNFVESRYFHPVPLHEPPERDQPAQLFGDVWEWTGSAYLPYPCYKAFDGAFGEYNGKFMCNQMVLRGGSCVSPMRHLRSTYRNFFPPDARWQFTGIRLAR